MKNKRIAFISEHASPLTPQGGVDCGGQNIYVAETARELGLLGYKVDIFTRKNEEHLPQIFNWLPNVRIIHVDAGPANHIPKEELFQHMPAFSSFMKNFITEENLDYSIIHAHFWMSGWVAVELKKMFKIPFTITFHALGLVRLQHQKEEDKFPKERVLIEKSIIAYADKIVAECPQDKEDLIHLYHAEKEKLVLIPCGFSPEEFEPINKRTARKFLKLNPNDRILLQLGRMVPRKGIDNVIRSLKFLPESLGKVKLLIVGGEHATENGAHSELSKLNALAEQEGVADQVFFTGPKSREVLKYYYAAADVFISTPWYEPFGITPLEAMACGTPVIGSNVGGIKYSIEHEKTGFLIPPKNPEVLAEKLTILLGDEALLKFMGMHSLKRVNEHFTWEWITRKLIKLYEIIGTQQIKNKAFDLKSVSFLYGSFLELSAIKNNVQQSDIPG